MPRRPYVAFLLAGAIALTGCSSGEDETTSTGAGATDKGTVTVGAFNFGESQILAAMYAAVLDKAGYDATIKQLTNREVVEPALEKGDIDVVPEYVGTLTEFLNKKVNGPTAQPQASNDLAKTTAALRTLAEPRGLTVLEPSPAADQNAFAVTQEFAQQNNLSRLSDLAGYKGKLTLGGPPECPKRPFCQLGLETVYGLKLAAFKSLDAGGPLTKQAIKQGQVQLGLVFSSDGGIEALGLKVLEDDKGLQTVDNIVPVVHTKAASADLTAALNAVSAALTTADLVALNKQVDIDRADPQDVAEEFLKGKGLL